MRDWPFLLSVFVCYGTLYAHPTQPEVIKGSAAVSMANKETMEIVTSDRAILHWDDFSIGSKETARFIQPSSRSAVLNRVVGKNSSFLFGRLEANGKIYLINPNGMIIGKEAVIDTAAFIGSTLDLSNDLFLEGGELLFKGDSTAAITNYGKIHAWDGSVVLLGCFVDDQGEISSTKGAVAIGSGREILLKMEDKELLTIRPQLTARQVDSLQSTLQNEGNPYAMGINVSGKIDALHVVREGGRIILKAEEGPIEMTGSLTAPQGEIEMRSKSILSNTGVMDVSGEEGGTIALQAEKYVNGGKVLAEGTNGPGGRIEIVIGDAMVETSAALTSVSGTTGGGKIILSNPEARRLFTSGTYKAIGGGDITFLGKELLFVAAEIDASGERGGGNILLGGDLQGNNPAMKNSSTVYLNPFAKVTADASSSGNGGKVIVWSEDQTECYGSLSAQGGSLGGDGGLIEVSSRQDLIYQGKANASAVRGKEGRLLLDPKNITVDAVAGIYPQFQLIDPNVGGGTNFGSTVQTLSTGNVVVTKPNDNFGATNGGAVYLYNGFTGALISALRGNHSGDLVGSGGVTALSSNGNYVVGSASWNGSLGAVTWGSGTLGVTGFVSSSNSLVGSTANDQIGNNGVIPLTNGNYVVNSPNWDGASVDVGAVTWGNGATGTTGVVSSANSLVGSTLNDQIGNGGVTPLTNGNYVVDSPNWDGAAVDVGAVTWGNGISGTSGTVSSSNSLVGSTLNDQVGSNGIDNLLNGNYVVISPNWDGAAVDVGAVTWGNGTSGTFGTVSSGNSLVGSTLNDQVGSAGVIDFFINSNYVVRSPNWNGAFAKVGAATWGNGLGGTVGAVSSLNSLVGSNLNDQVSISAAASLMNGNYVVGSAAWNSSRGAATWGDGTVGVVGTLGSGNSLVGSNINDNVGNRGIVTLSNGNYVVNSSAWKNGLIINAGASTWGNGSGGTVGAVTTGNSLYGSQTNDTVAIGSAIALTNGNYVVHSPNWANVAATLAGAVTWGNGTIGTTGAVSSLNSLVGSTASDRVGQSVSKTLTNGNYVARSPSWSSTRGAATWGNGLGGTVGTVSSGNSLVGSTVNDQVSGTAVTSLSNGNYVVRSPLWDGAAVNVGAATWGNGMGGTVGAVSSANSLVGSTANDQVSSGLVLGLTTGSYVVRSPSWNSSRGAYTWGNGTTGITGVVNAQNSIIGGAASAGATGVFEDSVNTTFLGRFLTEGSGRVSVGLVDPNQLSYARGEAASMTIIPSFILNSLNSGTAVTLQANTDITVNSAMITSAGGSGGNLSLSAGRSLILNANINTDGGKLTLVANDTAADGVVPAFRDSGNAVITVANGVALNGAGGNVSLTLSNGTPTVGLLSLGSGSSVQTTGAGTVSLNSSLGTIALNGATLSSQAGALTAIAGINITSTGSTLIQTTTGALNLVTDGLFPSPPLFGSGAFSLAGATLQTSGGALRLYTSTRAASIFPSVINGTPFVQGEKFLNTQFERWGVYYPQGDHGYPFTVFYKEIGVPESLLVKGLRDFYIAIPDPWQELTAFNDRLLFSDALYVPCGTVTCCQERVTNAMPLSETILGEDMARESCYYMLGRSYFPFTTRGPIFWRPQLNPATPDVCPERTETRSPAEAPAAVADLSQSEELMTFNESLLSKEPVAKLQFGPKFALTSPDSILRKAPMPHPDMSLCEEIEPALQSSNLDPEASFATGSKDFTLWKAPAHRAEELIAFNEGPQPEDLSSRKAEADTSPSEEILALNGDPLSEDLPLWQPDTSSAEDLLALNEGQTIPSTSMRGILLVDQLQEEDKQTLSSVQGVQAHRLTIPGGVDGLEKALAPYYMNQELTTDHLVAIKRQLILYYRDHGHPFVVVQIPEQEISHGVVTMTITETKVGQVTYKGNRWVSDKFIKKEVPICPKEDLFEDQLLNDLSWINRNPFHHTNVTCSPGQELATTDVELTTKDRFPLRLFAGGDNSGTRFTGRSRWFGGINWGDAFWMGDLLSYQFTTSADTTHFRSHVANYTSFLPWRHVLNLYGGFAKVRPDIKDFHSTGISYQGSLRYTIPFKPFYQSVMKEMFIGCDIKHTNNNLIFLGENEVPVINDTVNLSQLAIGYTLGGVSKRHELSGNLELYYSPGRLFSHQKNRDFENLRAHAKNNYAYGRITFEDIYTCANRCSLAGLVRLQAASGALLPSEQFGLGGFDTVRGYDERSFNSDDGGCLNFELRSPPYRIGKRTTDSLTFLLFADYGLGYNSHSLHNTKSTQWLAGAGPGIRYGMTPYLSVKVDYGFRLHRVPEQESSLGNVYISLIASY